MADWPIAGMNNQGFPMLDFVIERIGRPTLVSAYEDGGEDRRQKHTTQFRRWRERWELNRVDMKAVITFYETKGTVTSFSRLAMDAMDGTFGTDTATCRFERSPTYTQFGPNRYHCSLVFKEVTA